MKINDTLPYVFTEYVSQILLSNGSAHINMNATYRNSLIKMSNYNDEQDICDDHHHHKNKQNNKSNSHINQSDIHNNVYDEVANAHDNANTHTNTHDNNCEKDMETLNILHKCVNNSDSASDSNGNTNNYEKNNVETTNMPSDSKNKF